MSTRERPRSPGVTLAIVMFTLLVLVATIALTQRQPPPPSIAEFAPQSTENITDAPDDQSSSSGKGPGDCVVGLGGACEGAGAEATPTPPPPIDVPRVRKCVGDPPRQTEDPQSPPCVAYWKGDNGGATYKGVTRDQFNVVFSGGGWGHTKKTVNDSALEAFFNRRFEFYGRRLNLIYLNPVCCPNGANGQPEYLRADAVKADEQLQAFASLPYRTIESDRAYYEELARRKVVNVSFVTSPQTNDVYDAADPYMWTYQQPLEQQYRHITDWVCRGLVGRRPRFSAAYGPLGSARRFGLVYTTFLGVAPPLDVLRSGMRSCGAGFVEEAALPSGTATQAWNDIAVKMRSANVSTLMCMCEGGYMGQFMTAASGQKYYPEWFTSSYYKADSEEHARSFWSRDEAQQQFGIIFQNKFLPIDDEPGAQAVREMSPGATFDVDEGWQYTKAMYESLLLLASGVQMAGPRLTPESFRDGLRKAVFPNPGAGGPPNYQGRVSFRTGHAMNGGGTIMWFDNTAVYEDYGSTQAAQKDAPGSFCFAELGKRYDIGTYPDSDAVVRTGPCR